MVRPSHRTGVKSLFLHFSTGQWCRTSHCIWKCRNHGWESLARVKRSKIQIRWWEDHFYCWTLWSDWEVKPNLLRIIWQLFWEAEYSFQGWECFLYTEWDSCHLVVENNIWASHLQLPWQPGERTDTSGAWFICPNIDAYLRMRWMYIKIPRASVNYKGNLD